MKNDVLQYDPPLHAKNLVIPTCYLVFDIHLVLRRLKIIFLESSSAIYTFIKLSLFLNC